MWGVRGHWYRCFECLCFVGISGWIYTNPDGNILVHRGFTSWSHSSHTNLSRSIIWHNVHWGYLLQLHGCKESNILVLNTGFSFQFFSLKVMCSRTNNISLQKTNMMLIGGILLAIAIEKCNLHRRIAIKILLLIGTNPRW